MKEQDEDEGDRLIRRSKSKTKEQDKYELQDEDEGARRR